MSLTTQSDDTASIMQVEDAWQVPTYAKIPIALVEGAGCHVIDADGRRYLDMYGGHCVALTGHCHPALVEAIREQAGRLLFYSNVAYSDARARAAQAVAELAPVGLRRVFFCNSGTEANETALKMARRATGRRGVVSMLDGFHGRTLGSLGPTGPASYKDASYPIPTEHVHVEYGDADAVVSALASIEGGAAAVMLEPIPSMGGIRMADPAYFHALRDACDEAGALLIFDEVQTGFGRTGAPFFGMRSDVNVTPDFITAAKGVASGVPAGLVLVKESIAAAIKPGEHGTTFGGGPLAAAAIAATMRIIVDEDLPANAARVGRWIVDALADVHGVVSVTGAGLLLGVNLDRPARSVVKTLREDHAILTGGAPGDPSQLRLLAPLVLTEDHAQEFVTALTQVLAAEPAT